MWHLVIQSADVIQLNILKWICLQKAHTHTNVASTKNLIAPAIALLPHMAQFKVIKTHSIYILYQLFPIEGVTPYKFGQNTGKDPGQVTSIL